MISVAPGSNSAVGERQSSPTSTANKLRVVLFSGGTGTHSITETLLKHPQIALTVLINAYDDGHSTGRLRRFIPGMLGPSDVRKNINRLMPVHEARHRALRAFSDYRLPVNFTEEQGFALVRRLSVRDYTCLPPEVRREAQQLSLGQFETICEYFEQFYTYSRDQRELGRCFDYRDCALGNILFAGCFLRENRDFNRTIASLNRMYEIRGTLLNITSGENLFLAARREDGSVLRGEAEMVSVRNPSRIAELFLIDGSVYLERIDGANPLADSDFEAAVQAGTKTPELNPEASEALQQADVIIYGPGTQHSSLLPSYLTRGVGECIAANALAEKVLVANIHRDVDLPQEDAADLVAKFLVAMSRNGEFEVDWNQVATRFFLQHAGNTPDSMPAYIPFAPDRFGYPAEAVCVRDWENTDGRHDGGYLMNELQQIVQRKVDIVLQPCRHLVSIVVPVWNEARTIEPVLRRLTALDLQRFELSKEIIVVDGASTDGTFESASQVQGVKTFRLPKNEGRGAAMRAGLDRARGDIVLFFSGDAEYRVEDIASVISPVLNNEYKAVFGTRNVKLTDLGTRLSQIYGNARGLYMLSKYGGMLLSMVTLFLYNRYVSDPLTCLMAFDAALLRSLNLQCDGLDIHTEIVSKLCRGHEYILEIPVDYKPRTRAEGKKTTPLDGFRAMIPLVRGKYAGLGR